MATVIVEPLAGNLGPIAVPTPPTIGAFPLRPDFGLGIDYAPPVITHTFDEPELKTEQRFLMAPAGARRFRFSRNHLSCTEYDDLKTHFEQARGAYAQFPYTVQEPGAATETVMVRYENPAIQFDYLVALLMNGPGITFLEVPQTTPAYTSLAVNHRFPDSVLAQALQAEFQQIIPLITITPRSGAAGAAYLSNQAANVDGQTYLPRLLEWSGITQSIGENADAASFNFGNADGVWTQYVNQINLYAATVHVCLFHVQSRYRLELWTGYATNWSFDTSGKFQVNAADGVYLMGIAYPSRKLLRTCWKVYKGRYCPSTASFPDCPKDYDACIARGVSHSFGGFVVPRQTVRVKDNTTGVFGFGRSTITSVTVAQDTIYQRPLQEVWTDVPMLVTADVAGGRDEGDFYAALGVVGEGPISGYDGNLIHQTLDAQPPQDPLHASGWRGVVGNDPSGQYDYVGISTAPWGNPDGTPFIPTGSTFAGGIAFAEIRRTDQKGLQLAPISDHAMTISVAGGIGGWVWWSAGNRDWINSMHNAVWIALNVYLRGIGLRVDSTRAGTVPPAVMEQYFDVDSVVAAAAICDATVPKLIGTGEEMQFPFRGVLKEQKPLRDWLREILNCCGGYYTFNDGKLSIGIRSNSSVLAGNAFTRAHVLFKTLSAAPLSPQFNWIVGQFGDEEFGWQLNNVSLYDIDHAAYLGTPDSPQYLTSQMNYSGVSNKSQCARLITTRLREEIGGLKNGGGAQTPPVPGTNEQAIARNFQFKTTVVALGTGIGDIISMTDPSMPSGYAEGRVTHWALNPDFSITIQASCTFDDMYDLVVGPKPTDATPPAVPQNNLLSASGLAWMPNELAPYPGDPIYRQRERTFGLWQSYVITKDGVWQPVIWVQGKAHINRIADQTQQPRVLKLELVPGGALAGPMTVYAAVTVQNADVEPIAPSNLSALWIPQGVTGQALKLTIVPPTSDFSTGSWSLWAASDRRAMAHQTGAAGNIPATYTFPGPVENMTIGMPNTAAWGVRLAAKHIWHGGVAGLLVNAVTAPNQIQALDFLNSTDNWIGRKVSIVSNTDGQVPLWNFQITGFVPSTGTLTVTPDCVRAQPSESVQAGDVMIVWAQPTAATASSITDTMWDNSVNRQQFPGSNGLDQAGVNSDTGEVGRIVRIMHGTGAGQQRIVTSNDRFTMNVTPDWDTLPDSTSLFIVESAGWPYFTDASSLATGFSSEIQQHLAIPNLADELVLVGGFLIDVNGVATDEAFACYRMIWVFGAPPTVRIVGPTANDPSTGLAWLADDLDSTIRCDTSTSVVNVQLPPIATYEGRELMIWNDGGNIVHVTCAAGEFLFDGNASVDIPGFGASLRLTAGSNIVQAPSVSRSNIRTFAKGARYKYRAFPR